jgi:hypothetical protein
MRSLLGKVAPVLALAFVALAWGSPAGAAHAVNAPDVSGPAVVCAGDAATLDAFASGPLSSGPSQPATDPAEDADRDTLEPEQEAPEALPVFGGMALDAPPANRLDQRSATAEDTMDRAILPVVQPPRG